MKLKAIALSVMLLAAGGASANPTLQHCSPMEVVHNGSAGLSYVMACAAGEWNLRYSGSIPSGTEAVTAQYRLLVTNGDGSRFTHTRSVRLPSPAALGQALVREAVQLSNGDLALRDCPDYGCTLYRPLGGSEQMARATITVTPELKRLSDEAARLAAELASRQDALAAQTGRTKGLEAEVSALKVTLSEAQALYAEAQKAHSQSLAALQEQHSADLAGLLASAKSTKDRADQEQAARGAAREAELKAQLTALTETLAKASQEQASSTAAATTARKALEAAEQTSAERARALEVLQDELRAARGELARRNEVYDAQRARLADDEARGVAQAQQAEALVKAGKQVVGLTEQVRQLQDQLASVTAQLDQSRKAEAQKADGVAALEAAAKERDGLAAALEQARATLAQLRTDQWAAVHTKSRLTAQLEALQSQQEALMRQSQWSKPSKLRKANAALKGQLAASHAEVGRLSAKLAALEQGATPTAEVSALRAELAKVVRSRDAIQAQHDGLSKQLAQASTDYDKMAAERIEAYRAAQQVAKDMLEVLDQYQALEASKQEADAALASSTTRVMELTAKLEVVGMARDLAMQAADSAHADADTQHLKTKEVVARLEKAEERLSATLTQRDALLARLERARDDLAAGQLAAVDQTTKVQALESQLTQLNSDRAELLVRVQAQSERIQFLENLVTQQAQELESLRKITQERQGNGVPATPQKAP